MLRNFILHFTSVENLFGGILNKHASLLLEFEPANHVLLYLFLISVVQFNYSSADLIGKEKSIVFYLAGYVFSISKNNQNSPEILRGYLRKQELPEYKLVNTKHRGGLWKVTADIFDNFYIAEHIFKKHTETCSNKIDGQLITKAVLEDIGTLAIFSKFKINVNDSDNEIIKNILEDLIHLYIETRRSKMDAHKLLLRKSLIT